MKKFLKMLILPVVVAFSAILFVGCGELKNYDMSNISFNDKIVEYTGTAQSLAIGGTLPEGVTVSYEYYKGGTKLDGAPTNAGEYKVVAKFVGDTKNYNAIQNLEATLIIEQAEIPVVLGAKQRYDGSQAIDLDTPKTFTNNNGTFSFEYDGFEYVICLLNDNASDYDIQFYSALKEDGTVDEQKESQGRISKTSDIVYALITSYQENPNYKDTRLVTIKATNRVVNISTADDLKKLVTDITKESETYDLRFNTTYNLLNDIDLSVGNEKGLWEAASWYPTSSGLHFNSEFNGNGHTIKNFKLTNDSIEDNPPAGSGVGFGDTMVGFFGFVKDAYIHDVNFSDFEVDLDVNEPLFVGIVVARIEDNNVNADTHSNSVRSVKLENIKVENGTCNVVTKKAYCGIFIGKDNANKGVRTNLDAKNVVFNISNKYSTETMKVAGIVGENGKDGTGVTYQGCDLENIELHNGALEGEQSQQAFVGAFVAHNRSASRFVNCTITNFVMDSHIANAKMNGYYGDNSENGTPDMVFENCSHTNPKEGSDTGIVQYSNAEGSWTGTDVAWIEPQGPVVE